MPNPQQLFLIRCFDLALQEVLSLPLEERPKTRGEFAEIILQYSGNGKHEITLEVIQKTLDEPLSKFIPI